MADNVRPIEEQMEIVERRYGTWQNYVSSFALLNERQRSVELAIFDESFNSERAITPTKEFAGHWNRRRELGHLDSLLRKAQR